MASSVAKQAVKLGSKTSKLVDKNLGKVAKQPKQIVTRAVNSYTLIIWSIVLTIFGLSFFYLIITSAQKNPNQVKTLFQYFPTMFDRFVNPFDEKPKRILPPIKKGAQSSIYGNRPQGSSPFHQQNVKPITKVQK